MKYAVLTAAVLGIAWVVAPFANCQEPGKSTPKEPTETDPKKTESAPDKAAELAEQKKKEAEEAKKKKARLDKIKQLRFDRTTHAILESWAPQSKDEEEKEKKEDKEKKTPTPDEIAAAKFDEALKNLREFVVVGRWEEIEELWKDWGDDEAEAAYKQILSSLQRSAPPVFSNLDASILQAMQRSQNQRTPPPPNAFSFGDIFGLVRCAPDDWEWEEETIDHLAKILRTSISNGNLLEVFVEKLKSEDCPLEKIDAARLLGETGYPKEMGGFLPDLKTALAEKNHRALNLLSQHLFALYSEEDKSAWLNDSWEAVMAVLDSDAARGELREEALRQAVLLSQKIDEKKKRAWLEEAFSAKPERGKELLRVLGATASLNQVRYPTSAQRRLEGLELQSKAVETLIEYDPQRAAQWKNILTLLASNWLREGELARKYDSTSSLAPGMRRDRYGNYYYADFQNNPVRGRIQAISSGKLLETRPSGEWIALSDRSLQPKFDILFAQLLLKVGEEDEAFPHVEKVAAQFPKQGKELVDEFLRVWTRNHDPNFSRNRSNYYSYYYGYERKAESIPLTRSKQERNLVELAAVVERLRRLPLDSLDEDLLANAFTTCHSSAEVYQLSAIEKVFGSIESLKPETLAALIQRMRRNLAGLWRSPEQQKKSKTNRKKKDIEAEVRRGYATGKQVIASALLKHPESWQLHLAKAAIGHDEINYEKEINQNSDYAAKRIASLNDFAKAADLYVSSSAQRKEEDETVEPFQQWFYASLGATELSQVDDTMISARKEPARILASLNLLPGEMKDRHLAKFAQSLFTRMSGVKPAVKHRYLRAGFEITGDHEDAAEAKKVYDYYNDLVTEIELETKVDGSSRVGAEEFFGLFVNIRHTREIERESGGFSRYLQNQNSGRYYYNYGRPNENYREKFEAIVRESLGEQFEIQSVTFQAEDVNSRASGPYGWRLTPYAYLLLKSKGPEVDQIPSLRLDLDFLDTSGYAVLPVESPVLPIDAASSGESRPFRDLVITQTLDERQSQEGKLILEVKASANGLVPKLEEALDLRIADFEVVEVEDEGLAISRFDPESPDNTIVSERSWLVSLRGREGLAALPKQFEFPTAKVVAKEMTYQRYVDADLVAVEKTASLDGQYGETSRSWIWILLGFVALAGVGWWVYRKTESQAAEEESWDFELPKRVTPFTVIGLLKDIESNNGFTKATKKELAKSITRLERFYFSDAKGAEPDLQKIAGEWIERTRPRAEEAV